jgi:hypothetical protein
MASNDPLSLLPPAPKPTTGGATTAAPDDPLSLLPPAPKSAGTPPAAKDWRDDYPASAPGDILPDPRVTAAIGRVGQAAVGWQSATMQTPEAYAENQKTLLGQYVANPPG